MKSHSIEILHYLKIIIGGISILCNAFIIVFYIIFRGKFPNYNLTLIFYLSIACFFEFTAIFIEGFISDKDEIEGFFCEFKALSGFGFDLSLVSCQLAITLNVFRNIL